MLPLDYQFDKVHSQVHASVLHMGFSNSTARFNVKDGTISFDAADVASAKVDVTLNVAGISLGVLNNFLYVFFIKRFFEMLRARALARMAATGNPLPKPPQGK